MLKRGFTLIEIIITISIIAILAAVAFVQYQTFQKSIELTTESEKLITTLQLARDNTISSEGGQQYGVHVESDKYTLFAGDTYSESANTNEVTELSDDIEIYSINIAGGSDVIFERISGETTNSGSITLRIKNTNKERSLGIESSGQVGEEVSITLADTRITDTRHLHFNLGWSIQDASTLTLVFDNFPNPDVVQHIPMGPFFNADQTNFLWSETIDIDGEGQTLEINTHTLTGTDTELSIQRNNDKNTKPVTISIDTRDIVTYASDGTATVETFGGTLESQ